MAQASQPDDKEQVRTAVSARYASLAQAAQAGETITDCEPGTFTEGGFGPSGYADTRELPDGAVRASLGCGNPVAVADLRPGETVLDLGSGGGIDVLLSACRVGPAGKAYGLDMTDDVARHAFPVRLRTEESAPSSHPCAIALGQAAGKARRPGAEDF